MKKRWRIIILLGVIALLVYLVIAINFTSSEEDDMLCSGINIQITNKNELSLVTDNDVLSIIKSSNEQVIGTPIKNINIQAIQELLASKTYIKTVNVFTTIDGLLNVKLSQRIPFVRVHTARGAFYMDNEGFVFPLSNLYTHYVPVVTGDMPLPFNLPYKGELPDNEKSSILRGLLGFVGYLSKNSFWNAEIEQIHILPNTDVELIPRTGNHIIRLGNFYGHEYKLDKLFTFYKKVLPVEGWNKYTILDLRFGNQIVATIK